MELRVVRIDPHQAGLVAAFVYAVLGLVAVPIVMLASLSSGQQTMGPGFLVALPILYGVAGYLGTALVCGLFNLAAGRLGGVTLRLLETRPG
jgi:hypothetical protein